MYTLTQLSDGRYRLDCELTGISIFWEKGKFNETLVVTLDNPLFEKWCSTKRDLPRALAHEMRVMGDYLVENYPELLF